MLVAIQETLVSGPVENMDGLIIRATTNYYVVYAQARSRSRAENSSLHSNIMNHYNQAV